ELLATRDGPSLGALMRQHLLNKRDAVIELMRGGDVANATWASPGRSTEMTGATASTASAAEAPSGTA
ncbi:MAG: hypothetical protein RL375_443, partial [Pseudomonadota bacterium]